MGHAMATNLAKAGHEVAAWNRTPGKVVDGARMAATPRDAATNADVVWMCISDTAAVEQVLFGPEGAADALREGMIVADSSTIAPSATRDFAARVRASGVDYVDAPVTGSKIGARDATLTFIVGGEPSTIERLQPLFSSMGKTVVRMGDVGKGQSAKLAMNLMIAMIYEGFAEGVTLAAKLGVAPQDLVGLIQQSMVRSGVVDYKAPFVLRRDFSPNFPMRLMFKDMHLALDAAREARVKLPGLSTVSEVYELAIEEGMRDFDYAATLTMLEKWAGVEVSGAAAS
jgi:3-hydroxyisobutyrate dehydrogenase/2-hydroxy-3-oxopropionate reductase